LQTRPAPAYSEQQIANMARAEPAQSIRSDLHSGIQTGADAHTLADRLERNQPPRSDQAIAVKLIRALPASRAAGDVIELQGG
jgi:hypothetical protein